MICTNCHKKTDLIRSIIAKGKILSGCSSCLDSQLQQGAETTNKYYKREQQTKYRRELTQRVDPREFIKAYPKRARELYDDETMRKYSI